MKKRTKGRSIRLSRFAVHVGFYAGLSIVLTCLSHGISDSIEPAAIQPVTEVPFLQDWASSGHADATATAFNHWDNEDLREIPVECAKCHSLSGYQDFTGEDGSTVGEVDRPAPVGTVLECAACHNESTQSMNSVRMPSNVEIHTSSRETLCMQCHQGRTSMLSLDTLVEEANPEDDDSVEPALHFLNIHGAAAAATRYGTIAKGGYQYPSKSYDAFFAHVDSFDSCLECHDAHTLNVPVERCRACHKAVEDVDDLKKIRMPGSLVDYDGDGNLEEGIYYEIEHLQKLLYQVIQRYAAEKIGLPIVYASRAYPYFFIDRNKNSQADNDEIVLANTYNAWTARLLEASYNYQFSLKEPGAFAHGGKYIIQLLFDSIEDLNRALSEPVDLSTARRDDTGHFAGSGPAFRHWDSNGEVPSSCSKCHSSAGLPLFQKDKSSITQPVSNGLQCNTCHNDLNEFSRYDIPEVTFPSRLTLDSGDNDTNLCMSCHQGRQSMFAFDKWLRVFDDDTVSPILRFQDSHSSQAGATLFGTETKGPYEYTQKSYLGMFQTCDIFRETEEFKGCLSCHSSHGLAVEAQRCERCHPEVKEAETLHAIRSSFTDYDGDGFVEEGLAGEIDSLREMLYVAIQRYAREVAGTEITYDAQRKPYFFTDLNANGVTEPEETNFDNRYAAWTPRLLRAAYNYHYSIRDSGAFAHNGKYIIQILYDSLDNLKTSIEIDMEHLVRP